MILKLHGSMGDHIMMTGIPEAYYKKFGEKTKVISKYSDEFWKRNPYITEESFGKEYSLRFNSSKIDYMIYYPQRVFYEITGLIIDRKKVQPNFYIGRDTDSKLVIINDQAGWPSRRGYRYFNDLSLKLIKGGFHVCYLRNEGFGDCVGQYSKREITDYSSLLEDPSMIQMINKMAEAFVYIGYESGLSSMAGALKIPYVLFNSSVPPINVCHDTCIYYTDNCNYCCADQCTENCLSKCENRNDGIVEIIYGKLREGKE